MRQYLTLEGFSQLARSVKNPAEVKTNELVVVSQLPVQIRAVGDKKERRIEFIITTDRVDRDQDTIDPAGWDFKDYENNPVVLWCHDHFCPPIARAVSLEPSDNKVKSVAEFTPEDLYPFGYMTYRLYAEGFLHAVSVGYQPKEYTVAEDRKWGLNYLKQSLLEYSAVPVPSNPDALVVARSKGIDTRPMKAWAEQLLDENAQPGDARLRLEVLRKYSAPNGRALIVDLGDYKMADENKEKNQQTPPASAVKKVERWECGTDGHVHNTEDEAKSCADFVVSVTDATKMLQQLAGLVKSGRTVSAEAGALLRAVVLEVAPEAKAEKSDDDTEDEGDDTEDEGMDEDGKERKRDERGRYSSGDEEKEEDEDETAESDEEEADSKGVKIRVDEDMLTKSVTDAVRREFNKRTGRLD